MTFDGTNTFLDINYPPISPSAYSLEWIINTDTNVNYNQAIGMGDSTLVDWGSFMVHSSSTGGLFCGTDTATRFIPSDLPSVYVNGVNVHCAFTFGNGTASFYKNGSLVKTKTMNISTLAAFDRLRISTSVDGYLPAVKVYDRALSAEEVQQNFNTIKGRFGI